MLVTVNLQQANQTGFFGNKVSMGALEFSPRGNKELRYVSLGYCRKEQLSGEKMITIFDHPYG